MKPKKPLTKRDAVATPYHGGNGVIYWQWNVCPDCGKVGAHPSNNGIGGIRCG